MRFLVNGHEIACFGEVHPAKLRTFDIGQPVYHTDFFTSALIAAARTDVVYREVPRFPSVHRDLALVVDKNVSYSEIEKIALSAGISQLSSVNLFDIFESDKLGAGKKSLAVSFVFTDEHKTLTDKEIDGFMKTLAGACENKLSAVIRK